VQYKQGDSVGPATRSRMKAASIRMALLKDASNLEIMRPEMVGCVQTVPLCWQEFGGRHAFVHKLEEMGYKHRSPNTGRRVRRMKGARRRKKDIKTRTSGAGDQEIASLP